MGSSPVAITPYWFNSRESNSFRQASTASESSLITSNVLFFAPSLKIDSTNTAAATSQNVGFLGPTTAYSSGSGEKAILVGGTFANNTESQVNVTVSVYDNSAGTEVGLASKIPVPNGSSFVISDVGKTVLESLDEVRVYTDTANAIDASLSILKGVS